MLLLASSAPYWGGDCIEVNLSFDNLRDYQWKRLIQAIWDYPSISSPLKSRYQLNEPLPPITEMLIPEPTATFSQFGTIKLAPDITVGFELLITRSLFECVSVLIPLRMFEPLTSDDHRLIEKQLFDFTMYIFDTVSFDIAAFGVDRGCQLLVEMLSNENARTEFLQKGNFLIREDVMIALRMEPKSYKAISKFLRWAPPNRK